MFGMPDTGGGDFLPITNFHGKDGYWQRRENGAMVAMDEWAAVVDLANIHVGWINFSDGAPVFLLTRYGEPPVPDPEPGVPARDRKFNQGFKVTVVLPDGLGPHEFSSNARGTCGEVYKILLQYSSSEEAKAGKLPVVKCVGIEKRKSGKHSNPVPILEIASWVDRPASLDAAPTSAPAAAPAPGASTPPATGSTPVPPPTPQSSGGSLNFG